MQTPCKNCCFAFYDGPTQTDCIAGQLEVFENLGVNVIEAYDEEKEFYVIDKSCRFFRTKEWAENYQNVNDHVALAKLENMVRVDVLILVDEYVPEEKIKTILDSCAEQTVKLNSVFIVTRKDAMKYLKIVKPYGDKFKYKIELTHDGADKHEAINLAVNHCTGSYYTVVDDPYNFSLPNNFVEVIEDYVNKKYNDLAMIIPTEGGNGTTINRRIHNDYGGNSEKTIVEKIKILCEDWSQQNLIKKWEDFF